MFVVGFVLLRHAVAARFQLELYRGLVYSLLFPERAELTDYRWDACGMARFASWRDVVFGIDFELFGTAQQWYARGARTTEQLTDTNGLHLTIFHGGDGGCYTYPHHAVTLKRLLVVAYGQIFDKL